MAIVDKYLDFGIHTSSDISSNGIISFNVIDMGESLILFSSEEPMYLFFRVSVTQCSSLTITLVGDTSAATLVTGGADTEVIASGTFTADEVGTALVNDGTARYVSGYIPIAKQKAAMRFYGLFAIGVGTTSNLLDTGSQFTAQYKAGDAYVVRTPPTNMVLGRAAIPATPVSP